ncbi:hypothetical protein [Corynebacterium glyciniphilum]|uniref:hypothetical protein n=1 Tax=Corynebacterium glyciniphilum TaxID=1404244 RepID=UPI0021B2D958|nr:hypothetical protein [Corynebacterium glyciniphilum]
MGTLQGADECLDCRPADWIVWCVAFRLDVDSAEAKGDEKFGECLFEERRGVVVEPGENFIGDGGIKALDAVVDLFDGV